MKRFHVHLAVNDLAANIDFYTKLFEKSPSRRETDYARWMLDDPPLNFAVSSRGRAAGLNHFGMQVDTPEELSDLKAAAAAASRHNVVEQGEAACCYADSRKHWTVDPQGLAWEHFFTVSEQTGYGEDSGDPDGPCCIPLRGPDHPASSARSACCAPAVRAQDQTPCCASN
jgi:catechol 2,3-dioxygenase-like lactoylglutathione lyase family enzyme